MVAMARSSALYYMLSAFRILFLRTHAYIMRAYAMVAWLCKIWRQAAGMGSRSLDFAVAEIEVRLILYF